MDIVRLSIHPRVFFQLEPQRRLAIYLMAICMLVVTLLHSWYFPVLPQSSHPELSFYFELLILTALLFMFWVVQCSHVDAVAYRWLTFGMGLWLLAATADVMDELVQQPPWISTWFEDLCRAGGITFSGYGMLRTMYFVCGIYSQLKQQALSDELTSLPNRRYFRQVLEQQQSNHFSVAILDLDFFKKINDQHGHDCGDAVLRNFAAMLRSTVPDDGIAARLGGEEFALLLPEHYSDQLDVFFTDLLAATRRIMVAPNHALTVSIGLACRKPGETIEQLLKRADQALYLAKNSGRDQMVQL